MNPPAADIESAPFWAALRAHRIVLQRCAVCDRIRFPPMPGCPYCGARGVSDAEVEGVGTLYSWIRVHRALTPGMAADVPYDVGVVDLDAGTRMLGRLVPSGPVTIGAAARPVFVDHLEWTELRFEMGGS